MSRPRHRVDLAGAVAVDLCPDVAEKSGQLRFVVGAHAFAGGTTLGFGGHDPDGTVFQRADPRPGLTSRYRAMAVISNRHVAQLLFRRLSKPSADSVATGGPADRLCFARRTSSSGERYRGARPHRGRSGRVFLYLRSPQRVNLLCSAEVLVVSCLSSPADPPEAQNRAQTPACYPAGQRQTEAGLKPGLSDMALRGRTDDGDALPEPGHRQDG